MRMCRGRLEAADDFVLRVDTDVILAAERVFIALSRPAPIYTFLHPFRPTPILGELTRLDPAVPPRGDCGESAPQRWKHQ